jgi:hypothetical protein
MQSATIKIKPKSRFLCKKREIKGVEGYCTMKGFFWMHSMLNIN